MASTSNSSAGNPPPPLFTSVNSGGAATGRQINLDDLFGDVFFTPDGEAVFFDQQNQQSRNSAVMSSTSSAVPTSVQGGYIPVGAPVVAKPTPASSSGDDQHAQPHHLSFATAPARAVASGGSTMR